MVAALIADLRAAVRALTAARGFTTLSLLTISSSLALCIIVLASVEAFVVRGLPYPNADRLFRVDYDLPNQALPRGLEQLPWSTLDDLLEQQIAWDLDVFYLLGQQYPESLPGAWVTPGYMHGFGVAVVMGRTFERADYQPGSPAVALISHSVWQRRFAADPKIVGRTFQAYVSDRPEEPESFTIIGVLPARLWHLNAYTEVMTPLKADSYPYQVTLRQGVNASLATERIEALVRQGIPSMPDDFKVTLTSTQVSYVGPIRPMLWAVTAAAGLVLLIAAANVAVLMLIRAKRREKELAVRLALGASHWRLTRALALEGLLLGTVATVGGFVISSVALSRIGEIIERLLDRRVPGGVDNLHIGAVTLVVGLITGAVVTLLCTALPLFTARRWSVSAGLSVGGRGSTSAHSSRARAVLIAVEIAASLTLMAGAGLMAETAIRMLRVDFGLDGEDVVTASMTLRQRSYPDDAGRAALLQRVEQTLAGFAGSRSLALGDWWPLQGSRPRAISRGGPDASVATVNPFAVTPDYFRTVGIELRDGRFFDTQDRIGGEPVTIISEALASRLFPRGGAVGDLVTMNLDDQRPPLTARIVGIVNDVRQSHTDVDLLDAYLPLAQRPSRFAFLYLRAPRASGWENELRAAVARIDPEVALGTPRRLTLGLDQERARPRFLAYLLTTFAGVAALLAVVGMQGVIVFAVRQRQREIAVRIAVGGTRRKVSATLVRQGLIVLAIGLAAGLGGGLGLGRVLQSQLFGVLPADPRVFATMTLALGLAALVAMWWPAWRAAAADPMAILKAD